MDGVVYRFVDAMRAELNLPDVHDPDRWNVWDSWGITFDEWDRAFRRGIYARRVFGGGHERLEPGAVEGLSELRRRGWWIRIVTAKDLDHVILSGIAQGSALDWMERVGVPFDEVAFVGGSKTGHVAQAVIDDKPATSGWAQPGARNLLFAQPWNRRHDGLAERIEGWPAVVESLSGHDGSTRA